MTDQSLSTIGYASPSGDEALAGWFRRVIGWAAIAYGGGSCVAQVYYIAVSRKWLSITADFGHFTLPQDALDWSVAGAAAIVCVAGFLILRRSRVGILALRLGLGLAIAVPLGDLVYGALREHIGFHWYAFQMAFTLSHSILQAMLIVLTFGPTGRALRRQ